VQQMGVVLARNSPIRVSLPRFHFRVGLHIVLFVGLLGVYSRVRRDKAALFQRVQAA
jgi:hypothetical protein